MKAISLISLSLVLAAELMAGVAEAAVAGVAVAGDGSFDKTVTVSGPVELDVRTSSGGITITQGSSGTVKVHAILKANDDWFGSGDVEQRIREIERNPPVEQSGNRVRIGYVQQRDLLKNISIRFEIQTPRDTRVQAHAQSGGIHVDGVQGPVECEAQSGGVEIRNVAADVHASAQSGGIHIGTVKGSVVAHTQSGGIEALDVAGGIEASAQSGAVRVSQTMAAPIRAQTQSGSVKVQLAQASGYDVSIETGSGSITTPEMTVKGAYTPHHVDGKIRGGGPSLILHAQSGSVHVE